eukprot:4208213-Prymnesium_polylepis.1
MACAPRPTTRPRARGRTCASRLSTARPRRISRTDVCTSAGSFPHVLTPHCAPPRLSSRWPL